jgi:hypothetical protein
MQPVWFTLYNVASRTERRNNYMNPESEPLPVKLEALIAYLLYTGKGSLSGFM